jgi:hypothetical protein
MPIVVAPCRKLSALMSSSKATTAWQVVKAKSFRRLRWRVLEQITEFLKTSPLQPFPIRVLGPGI